MEWNISNFVSSLVVAIPPTITAILAYRSGQRTNNRVEEIKVQINGRMEQMLRMAQDLGHSTGQLQASNAQSAAAVTAAVTAAAIAAAPVVAAAVTPAAPIAETAPQKEG